MNPRNHYEVLGVARSAKVDEIRHAYLQKSKLVHPDRFDQNKYPAEWNLANEKLKELNAAYAVLRDPLQRADYDARVYGAGNAAHAAGSRESRSPRRDVKLGRMKSGVAHFATLPKEVQERLMKRVMGLSSGQWMTKLQFLPFWYFIAVLLSGWLVFVYQSAVNGHRWSSSAFGWQFALTSIAAIAQCFVVLYIIKWHRSSLRPMFFVTPLYFVKTSLDKVWFWPLWELKSILGTHHHTNGVYTRTTVNLEFSNGSESINISKKRFYDELCEMLNHFTVRIHRAKANEDVGYFYDHDDFREFDPATAPESPKPAYSRNAKVICAVLLAYAVCFVVAVSLNDREPLRYVSPVSSSSQPSQSVAPRVYPAFPLPNNGQIYEYPGAAQSFGERIAPLKVTASPGSHCYIKLVEASTGRPVMGFFVLAGTTVEVSVPLGVCEMRYASGERWCGIEYLFGDETSYSRADKLLSFQRDAQSVSGHSITLYKVRNGNLKTESISREGF